MTSRVRFPPANQRRRGGLPRDRRGEGSRASLRWLFSQKDFGVGISILHFWGCRGSLTGDHILKVSLSASRLEKVRRFWLFLIISAVFVCIFPIGDSARSWLRRTLSWAVSLMSHLSKDNTDMCDINTGLCFFLAGSVWDGHSVNLCLEWIV